jgi:hypothetical protein
MKLSEKIAKRINDAQAKEMRDLDDSELAAIIEEELEQARQYEALINLKETDTCLSGKT